MPYCGYCEKHTECQELLSGTTVAVVLGIVVLTAIWPFATPISALAIYVGLRSWYRYTQDTCRVCGHTYSTTRNREGIRKVDEKK